MEYGVRLRFTLTLRSVRNRFTSVMIPIYLAVYCKMPKANFTCFPCNSSGKARAVFKLFLEVRSKVRKKRTLRIYVYLFYVFREYTTVKST